MSLSVPQPRCDVRPVLQTTETGRSSSPVTMRTGTTKSVSLETTTADSNRPRPAGCRVAAMRP